MQSLTHCRLAPSVARSADDQPLVLLRDPAADGLVALDNGLVDSPLDVAAGVNQAADGTAIPVSRRSRIRHSEIVVTCLLR
jgi:hypothetical protein